MQKQTREGGDSLKEKIDMAYAGKKLRELRGIRTRSGVGKLLNIPYSTLQSYETGTRMPPKETRQKLADYYGVPETVIFLPQTNR